MKASVCMAVLSLAVLGLAACATTGETTTRQSEEVDAETLYMARVEAIARQRGIDVTWVNPPRKAIAKDRDD